MGNRGLNPPEIVKKSTEEYFESEDQVGNWVNSECILAKNCRSKSKDLYFSYKKWSEENGEPVMPSRILYLELEKMNYEKIRMGNKRDRGFAGIGLKQTSENEENLFQEKPPV